MPAKRVQRVSNEGTYSHVYNKGVENRIIFNDDQDFEVFQNFLKDYLSSPADPESTKQAFTVNGKTFQGTPHQTKNYLNKVELLAFRLTPTHFHLILNQKASGSVANFIRSLCTRYSIFFNKKYDRKGSLFDGPYKSVQIKGSSQLLHFSRYLHRSPDNGEDADSIHSSYPEYLGKKQSSWVNTKVMLSAKGVKGYEGFVEKYKLNQKEKALLEGIPEAKAHHLERRDLESKAADTPITSPDPDFKPPSRIPEFLGIAVVFLVLTTIGIRNIKAESTRVLGVSATPASPPTLATSPAPEPVEAPQIKIMLMINAGESGTASIYKEPKKNSEIIVTATNGEVYEFVSINTGWFGVKLPDGTTGYIHSDFIDIVGTNNQYESR